MEKLSRSSSPNYKPLCLFLLLSLLGLQAYSQAPQAFNYQALARDAAGKSIANKTIKVKASIAQNSAAGTVEYAETHSATTDDQGVFVLELGMGTAVTNTFSAINWALGTKWLKIEMDATGGTNYSLVGASQLLSVPFALYAASAGGTSDPGSSFDGSLVNMATSTVFDNKVNAHKIITTDKVTVSKTLMDSDSNMYVYGYFTAKLALGSSTLTSNGTANFLIKISGKGDVIWSKKIVTTSSYTSFYDQLVLAKDKIILSFKSDSGLTVGTNILVPKTPATKDDYVIAFNSQNGETAWFQRFENSSYSNSGSPQLYTSGDFVYVNDVYARSGFKVGITTFSNTTSSFYLTQLNLTTGSINWAISSDPSSTGTSSISKIIQTSNKLYAVGTYSGNLKLGANSFASTSVFTSYFIVDIDLEGHYLSIAKEMNTNNYESITQMFLIENSLCFINSSTGTKILRKLNLTNNTLNSIVFPSQNFSESFYANMTKGYIYSNQLNKYDFNGTLLTTKKFNLAYNLTSSSIPTETGHYYFTSTGSSFYIEPIYYKSTGSEYFIVKYDFSTETVLKNYVLKNTGCSFLVNGIGNNDYVLSYNGQIKLNGQVQSGLVWIKL